MTVRSVTTIACGSLCALALAACGDAAPRPAVTATPAAALTVVHHHHRSPHAVRTARRARREAAKPAAGKTPATPPPTQPASPLAGKVITVDPGHNGGNFNDPAAINRLVPDGNGYKPCNTTGTAAPDGYRETDFNWYTGLDLEHVLLSDGAHVVLTRHSNDGVGPCVNQRAAIANRAHSAAAISIHADGGPPDGSGFAILVPAPIPSHANQKIIAPSMRLAVDLRTALEAIGLHPSTYDGVDGIAPRDDLGGLNLAQVPAVMVEVGNMQNAADERPMETSAYRQRVAGALAAGLAAFVRKG